MYTVNSNPDTLGAQYLMAGLSRCMSSSNFRVVWVWFMTKIMMSCDPWPHNKGSLTERLEVLVHLQCSILRVVKALYLHSEACNLYKTCNTGYFYGSVSNIHLTQFIEKMYGAYPVHIMLYMCYCHFLKRGCATILFRVMNMVVNTVVMTCQTSLNNLGSIQGRLLWFGPLYVWLILIYFWR